MLTPADLEIYLREHMPAARLLSGLGETPTVPAAALALGVDVEQIIKTLLFVVERPAPATDDLVVVISHGERRVDKALLAGAVGSSKKKVTLAPAALVLERTGYAVGGVPPVGHRTALPVYLDESVLRMAAAHGGVVYGGGGDDRTMLHLDIDDLLRLVAPVVLPLSM